MQVIVSRQTPKSKINTNKYPTKERDMLLWAGVEAGIGARGIIEAMAQNPF